MRIKEICDYVSRGSTPDYVEESPYKVMNQASFSKGYIDESKQRFTSKTSQGANIRKGDLLMASTGGGVLGKVFYFDLDDETFYADSHVTILRNSKGKNLMKYLYYAFSLKYDEINATMVKGSTNQTELQRNYLLSYELEIPTLIQQKLIVKYLDEKTKAIDARISILDKKKDAYMHLKASIINSAVTRGINPNVSLKDSGIDWVGMVPEHWEVKQFKNCVVIQNGRDYKEIETEFGIPVIGSGGQFAYASKFMYDGEVIFLGRKGTIDRPLYHNGKFWAVDTMFYAIPHKNMCAKYLYYYTTHFPFKKVMTQTALPSMTQTSLNAIKICIPTLSEQQSIATYLDNKCSEIDKAFDNIIKQIELLKQLKRSLINEVVTGKRKV